MFATDSRRRPASCLSAGTTTLSARTRPSCRVRSSASTGAMSRLAASTATQTVPVPAARCRLLRCRWPHREDDQVRAGCAEDGFSAAVDDQVAALTGRGRDVGREGHGPVPIAVRENGYELAGQAAGDEDGGGEGARHEPAGHERPAEFLDRDGELRQAEALPSVGLGYVQAEQALIGQAWPEHVAVVAAWRRHRGRPRRRPSWRHRAGYAAAPRLGPSRRAACVLPSGRAPSVHLICHDPAASARILECDSVSGQGPGPLALADLAAAG